MRFEMMHINNNVEFNDTNMRLKSLRQKSAIWQLKGQCIGIKAMQLCVIQLTVK